MNLTQKITIDMVKPGVPSTVYAVQSDTNTRAVEATLTANGIPVDLEGYTASVVFRKPDGTSGWYDMMPDTTSAVSIAGNIVTATLAPQVLTVPGSVIAAIRIELDADRVTTFPFVIAVEADPSAGGEKSTDYYRVSTWADLNEKLYDQIFPTLNVLANISEECVRFKTVQELTDEQKQTARNNIGAGIGDASIDNAAVGADAWSSKNIVDTLCPAFTLSGGAVRCQPVAGYPLQVTTALSTSEAGYTGITLRQLGKNLYDKDSYPLIANNYIKRHDPSADGTGGVMMVSNKFAAIKNYIPVSQLAGKTITLNHCPADVSGENTNAGMAFYDAGQVFISGTSGSTVTVPENAAYMRFSVPNEYTAEEIQIEVGTEVTGYEPYRAGSEFAVDFGKTVSGGSYDWKTGVLAERVLITPNSDDWYFNDAHCCFIKEISDYKAPAPGKQDCSLSLFPYVPGLGDNEVIELGFCIARGQIFVCYPDMGDDVEAFKAYIDAQKTAGAPLQFEYNVTPETVADGQQIPALPGTNTLYSAPGGTSVTGKADPVAVIDDLAAKVAALTETVTALLEG